jgi:hypothetical protein
MSSPKRLDFANHLLEFLSTHLQFFCSFFYGFHILNLWHLLVFCIPQFFLFKIFLYLQFFSAFFFFKFFIFFVLIFNILYFVQSFLLRFYILYLRDFSNFNRKFFILLFFLYRLHNLFFIIFWNFWSTRVASWFKLYLVSSFESKIRGFWFDFNLILFWILFNSFILLFLAFYTKIFLMTFIKFDLSNLFIFYIDKFDRLKRASNHISHVECYLDANEYNHRPAIIRL